MTEHTILPFWQSLDLGQDLVSILKPGTQASLEPRQKPGTQTKA